MSHIPVLQKEVINCLDPKPGENFIDSTVGSGGHAFFILERTSPDGKLLGIDLDQNQLKEAADQLPKERFIGFQGSYVDISEIAGKNDFKSPDGILADLGMSSFHIDSSKRGFTFLKDEPLDMRYDSEGNNLTAKKIVNEYSKEDLIRIFEEYGEERFSKKIAEKIIEQRKIRPIETTFQLIYAIEKAVPEWHKRGKIHFATKIFQALRIETNKELENLKRFIPEAIGVLKKGGRLTIISFHSLEDGIVKNIFKEYFKKGEIQIITKKPIRASFEEIKSNHRARSARLRAAVKL